MIFYFLFYPFDDVGDRTHLYVYLRINVRTLKLIYILYIIVIVCRISISSAFFLGYDDVDVFYYIFLFFDFIHTSVVAFVHLIDGFMMSNASPWS